MNAVVTPTNNNKTVGSTTTIKQNIKFQCRAEEFYNVFSTIEVIILPYSLKRDINVDSLAYLQQSLIFTDGTSFYKEPGKTGSEEEWSI